MTAKSILRGRAKAYRMITNAFEFNLVGAEEHASFDKNLTLQEISTKKERF